MTIEVNRDNFDEEVSQSDLPVLVDLWGPQCAPCMALLPAVEELEKEYEGKLKVAKLNAAENRMLCAKLRVIGLPTFLVIKNGQEVKRVSGESLTIDEIRTAVDEGLSMSAEKKESAPEQIQGKKVIIIGERDGVQGPAIEACVRSAGGEPIVTQTQCFV